MADLAPAARDPHTWMDLFVTLNPRTLFRAVAIAEACSWAGLLAGMFFKHVTRTTEVGVQVFGPIHGVIFVAYLVSIVLVRKPLRWGRGTVLVAAIASIPPFATLVFELWAERRGRLTPVTTAPRERVATPA